ncbi:MAG: GlsB/YeaQ/YmgE family stress response membrane protein [Thermoanaerobaculia bacterium]|nr:GlsB/YeaQ/YmgE family stress response membrane protein [Thermoanaerobaculia bacterium]MCZ7649655.1 GlsB/YeaQ/YmgE family stress response membrane protein [Thermoanaerobaculia bacterium]
MGILSWIAIGLLAGALARFLLPGRQRLGCFATTAVGVLGGLLGGFLATLLGFGGISGFDLRSLAIATGGALLLLLVFGLGSRRDE